MKREASNAPSEKRNKLTASISGREFLKYSGVTGGALLLGLPGGLTMASSKSRVAQLKGSRRKQKDGTA
jgi:hypothetical protein